MTRNDKPLCILIPLIPQNLWFWASIEKCTISARVIASPSTLMTHCISANQVCIFFSASLKNMRNVKVIVYDWSKKTNTFIYTSLYIPVYIYQFWYFRKFYVCVRHKEPLNLRQFAISFILIKKSRKGYILNDPF